MSRQPFEVREPFFSILFGSVLFFFSFSYAASVCFQEIVSAYQNSILCIPIVRSRVAFLASSPCWSSSDIYGDVVNRNRDWSGLARKGSSLITGGMDDTVCHLSLQKKCLSHKLARTKNRASEPLTNGLYPTRKKPPPDCLFRCRRVRSTSGTGSVLPRGRR